MTQITRTCKNNEWQQRFFVYKLNDGTRYTLEYWFNVVTGEKRVYCKELYESIGESPQTFNDNFHFRKFGNETWVEGTNNRSLTCDLKDALSYAIDRFKLFRDTFKECGLNALESKEDGDLLGMIASTVFSNKEIQMNQIQNRESEQWIQNTLTINTKNGAYPVRYWWNGATALVAGKDGREDAGISEDVLRKDSERGKIQTGHFVPPKLLVNFDPRYTPKFYDLTEWLKYLSAKIKPIREAFVEVGAGCLSGFATDGLRGMLIKGLGMTEEQASLTVVKSYDDSVGYLLDTVDEEGLDALEVITKDREERMKEAFAQRRARLQAEKKAAQLEIEVEEERSAKEEAIEELDEHEGLLVEKCLIKEVLAEHPILSAIKSPYKVWREWCWANLYTKGCYTVLESSPFKRIFNFDGNKQLVCYKGKRDEAKQIIYDVLRSSLRLF